MSMWDSGFASGVIIAGLLIFFALMLAKPIRHPRSFSSKPVLKDEIKRTPPPPKRPKPGECHNCGSEIYPGRGPAHPTARIFCARCYLKPQPHNAKN